MKESIMDNKSIAEKLFELEKAYASHQISDIDYNMWKKVYSETSPAGSNGKNSRGGKNTSRRKR